MTEKRITDYLGHILEAAQNAVDFTDGLEWSDFAEDKRTQQACIMNLLIIGEAAAKLMDKYPEFTQVHSDIPWQSMRGMRNRIAHGYFEIDLQVVWQTIQSALPELLVKLKSLSTD